MDIGITELQVVRLGHYDAGSAGSQKKWKLGPSHALELQG